MRLSVHIVTQKRLELLRQCLESVLVALPESAEILVVVNGGNEETIRYLTELGEPRLKFIDVPLESISASRNRGFTLCSGEIVHYLDDDVIVPRHLFSRVLEIFESYPNLAILGGPNLTPPGSSFVEDLFGAVMTNPFAAPGVAARYTAASPFPNRGPRPATDKDLIFCNLALRRNKIPSDLHFREKMRANQENLFLFESRAKRLQVFADPEIFVFHRRRKNLLAFGKQIANYGDGRFQQSKAAWESLSPQYLVPSISVLTGLAAILVPSLWPLLSFFLLLHQVLAIGIGIMSPEIRRLGGLAWLAMGPLTLCVHFSYGLGFITGFFREFSFLNANVQNSTDRVLKSVEFSS